MATLPKTLPKLTPHSIPDPQLRVPSVRLTPDNTSVLENLGLLANLAGTWKGTGFNLVARPDKEQNTNLYLELNQTREGRHRAVRIDLFAADHRFGDWRRSAY